MHPVTDGSLSGVERGPAAHRDGRRADAPQHRHHSDVHRADPQRGEHQPGGFSHACTTNGQVFAIFVITDAVAEAAVGLGILIALFRNKETVLADEIDLLKW
jgi:hypothetical protein